MIDREGLGGSLTLGCEVIIDPTASIDTSGDVTIGDYAVISEEVLVFTHAHDMRCVRDKTRIRACPLEIGARAFIGARAVILPQVSRIGEGAVIGAGAVVTKDVPDGQVWAGNPARFVRMLGENDGTGHTG